jgi:replicative DNA helicase
MNVEESILGTCIAYPENCDKVFETLKAEHFAKSEHQIIFKILSKLYISGKGYDLLIVTKELHSSGKLEQAGGMYYVTQLTNHVAYGDKLESYVYIVLESFLRRSIHKMVVDINLRASNETTDVFELISEFSQKLDKLSQNTSVSTYEIIEKIKDDVMYSMTKAVTEGVSEGVKSGINSLNRQTNGWQKSDLIILAGRPGMGKTSAAIDFGLTPALENKTVLLFSLEMSSEQITKRIQSILSGVDVQRVVNNTLNKDELKQVHQASERLNNIPLYLDDTPAITVFDFKNRAKKLQREKGLDLIIVDYLQLMRGEAKNRENEISEISRGLKAVAKELNVPVIALSQLSRKCEDRADKKPMLSDLRESGAIEQDADMVIFCHRPEYYGIHEYEIGGNLVPSAGLFVFMISKFRNGQTGEIKARWIGNNTMVTNYDVEPLPNNNDFF